MARRLFHFSYKLYLTSLTFEGKIIALCNVSNLFKFIRSMLGKQTSKRCQMEAGNGAHQCRKWNAENLYLNSSTIDELGSWCLRRAGGAGQQFWQREGGIHRNPASGHCPGTVTLIESVEYLPAPNTYPREGGVGKKSSAK